MFLSLVFTLFLQIKPIVRLAAVSGLHVDPAEARLGIAVLIAAGIIHRGILIAIKHILANDALGFIQEGQESLNRVGGCSSG